MVSKIVRRLGAQITTVKASAAKNPAKAVFYAAILIVLIAPIAFLGYLLARYSVNVIFWDQWFYADLVDKWRSGTLGFYDLWVQHNEHRIMVPKFFQLVLSSVTGWNMRFEVMMNFVFALTSFGLMVAMLRRTFSKKWLPVLLVAPLIAWLFFSPVQYINWIWGFQLAWFMSITAVCAVLWALNAHQYKNIDRFFIFALVAAVLATYCNGNGMLIWVAGAVILLLKHAGRRHYTAWAVTAVLAIAGYFYKLNRADQESPISVLIHRPGDVLDYLYQFLGHNLGATPGAAKKAGILLLVLLGISLVLLWRKKRLEGAAPWLALALYGFLVGLLAAVSRMPEFGVDHSMVFSYTTMSVLFVIGAIATVAYTAYIFLRRANRQALNRYLIIAFVFGLFAWPLADNFWQNYTGGVKNLKNLSQHLSKVRQCVLTAESKEDDCLLMAYPNKESVWERIEILKKYNWDDINRTK